VLIQTAEQRGYNFSHIYKPGVLMDELFFKTQKNAFYLAKPGKNLPPLRMFYNVLKHLRKMPLAD